MTLEQVAGLQTWLNDALTAMSPRPWEVEQKAADLMAAGAPDWDYLLLQSIDASPRIILTQYRG